MEAAAAVAAQAVKIAATRDGYSGGFVSVFFIDKDGCHHLLRKAASSFTCKTSPPSMINSMYYDNDCLNTLTHTERGA